jgi:nucleoside-diphosphate-sugar epimerase
MANHDGALLVTGASGTVGTMLLPRVASKFRRIVAVGRTLPPGLRETDTFIQANLAVPSRMMLVMRPVPQPSSRTRLAGWPPSSRVSSWRNSSSSATPWNM